MINSSLSGILQGLIGREQCRQAILVTHVGSIVATAGQDAKPFALSLGPIIAAVSGTGRELSRLLGAGEQYFQLQRGRRQDLLLCPMPCGMILAASFPAQVDEGRVLDLADQLIEQIEALTPDTGSASESQPLSPELRDEATSFLDQLFPTAA
ncbi:hypothetical protein [Bryobacter aggregatus]|uniref:hypothetical protein n=1 Tax=Bryobacter aggregatus TaxID=360054 RepID=UPI0004E0F2B6|nr:hypothetical protein [Bryobacter aggregatus]